ncbi:hypothetical protein WBJ53_23110 [Spirosoma sp. SC4-14]|uniref:hypothetical protein n=1 Tax=Spirosoma sp. SC4-14 TaxID=3128900 RepID=UPI0030D1FDB1
MNYRFLSSVLIAFCITILTNYTAYAKPIWKFRVVVAVEKQTADFYQSMLTKDISQIVRDQMTTVNANFNSSSNFNGIYNFEVDSIYVFDGPATTEIFRPHPNYTYAVVIDGFSVNSQGGGWLGDQQVIYHKWQWSTDFASGPFGPGATDGLTHEFGHARGAVDIYGLRVEGSKNPVNNQTFEPVNSIMNYPYGNIVWDEYTTNLLNSTADGPIVGDKWVTEPFPGSITIKTVDAQRKALPGVSVELYPVEWFSYSVTSTPIFHTTTTTGGLYQFASNPFQPTAINYPWHIRYGNFLIKATYNSTVAYTWMPLYDVQNTYFKNGVGSVYTAEIQLPVNAPTISISSINATSFYSGFPIQVAFTTAGDFDQTNNFSLVLVDNNNNSFYVASTGGNSAGTLIGIVPTVSSTEITYKARVVSSKPYAQSEDILITVKPKPTSPLTVLPPTYDCQTGAITFNTSGGDGSPITYSAPGITRASLNSNSGIVELQLRNDPKIIPITATQNGNSATYNFELKTACSPQPPRLTKPIPDQFLSTGQAIPGSGFPIGLYFVDPSPAIPGYYTNWYFSIQGMPPGLYVFAKDEVGARNPIRVIFGTPTTAGVYLVTVRAATSAFPDKPVIATFTITVSDGPNPGSPLALLPPTYDCQTGAITFNTSGGDGSPITYWAPGITRASPNSNTGIIEQELRNDPKPIPIQATQNGQTVTYVFDFKAYCANPPQPPTTALTLLAPTYACSTGAFHFNTSGGDGSTIEYMAAGITGWTTNPDQFVDKESRTASDVQPFVLMARQSGVTTTYVWNLKTACGRARVATTETAGAFSLKLLGNPVSDVLTVAISGAEGHAVQLQLFDMRGRLIEERLINQESANDIQQFRIDQVASGYLLLRASNGPENQTIKIIKP